MGSALRVGKLWAARDYERAGEYRREALDLARALGDASLVARSLNRVGNWYANLDEPQAGLPHHEEALAIFERLRDQTGIAETVDLIAMGHHVGGEDPPWRVYERSVKLFTGWTTDGAWRTHWRCSRYAARVPVVLDDAVHERHGARMKSVMRSIRLAQEIGWRAGEVFIRFILGDCLLSYGEYDRATRSPVKRCPRPRRSTISSR